MSRMFKNRSSNESQVSQARSESISDRSPMGTAQMRREALLDGSSIQRKLAQLQSPEEEEALQGKFAAQLVEEEEPLQGKGIQRKVDPTTEVQGVPVNDDPALEHEADVMGAKALQAGSTSDSMVQREKKPNATGLPDNLKSGIENLSGMSMDGVKVHYNSSQPAQLNALAYAQGTDIHVGPGQEQHLPHEAWHVVQQAGGAGNQGEAENLQLKLAPLVDNPAKGTDWGMVWNHNDHGIPQETIEAVIKSVDQVHRNGAYYNIPLNSNNLHSEGGMKRAIGFTVSGKTITVTHAGYFGKTAMTQL